VGAQARRQAEKDGEPGHRGYQKTHREHHQRIGHPDDRRSWCGGACGFTPQEIEVDVSAMLQGETAAMPVVATRPALHDSRTFFRRASI